MAGIEPTGLPWEPLRRFLHRDNDGDPLTSEQIGARVGVDRRTIERWKASGVVPFESGETVAHHLRIHPTAIWDDYDPDLPVDVDEPPPAPAGHPLDAHVDRDTENLLDRRGHRWELGWAKVVDIDWDATSDAVVRPVDPVVVDRYTDAVRAGEAFPAVLATTGDDGIIILGGQHRVRAWDAAGVTEIPVYLVNPLSPGDRYLVAVEHNARHGAAFTEDERITHALAMVELHGLTQADAARRMGVTVHLLQKAAKARVSKTLVTRLGLVGSWRRFTPSAQWRIGMACSRDDTLFLEAVTTARNLGLDTAGVYEMCAAVTQGWKTGQLAGALTAIEDYEAERLAAQRAGTAGAKWGKGQATGGPPASIHGLREHARSIVEADVAAMIESCPPGDRAITVDLLRRATQRIAEVAAGLNRAAAAEGGRS